MEQESIVTGLAGKAVLVENYCSDGPGYQGPLVCQIGNGLVQVVCVAVQDQSGNCEVQDLEIDKEYPSIAEVLEYRPEHAKCIFDNLGENAREYCAGPHEVSEDRVAIVRWSNGAIGAIMFWGEACFVSAIHFEGDFKGERFFTLEDDQRHRFKPRSAIVEAIQPTPGQSAKVATLISECAPRLIYNGRYYVRGSALKSAEGAQGARIICLYDIVQAIKQDVLNLMKTGQIPTDVATFSQLHDYCDANCLGGLCDNATFDALAAQHRRTGETEAMPQGMINLINEAQGAVETWLQDRWPTSMTLETGTAFGDIPDFLGAAWTNLASAEDALAAKLREFPKGTAAVLDDVAWFLKGHEDRLLLYCGQINDGKLNEEQSRHAIGLEWIDIEEDQLAEETQRVIRATDDLELRVLRETD